MGSEVTKQAYFLKVFWEHLQNEPNLSPTLAITVTEDTLGTVSLDVLSVAHCCG